MKTATILLSMIVATLSVATLAGQSATKPNPYGISSPDAIAALKKFNQAEFKAWNEYDHIVASARGQLVDELKSVQTRATKAGSLDEAIRIRDAITDIAAGNKPKAAQTMPAADTAQTLTKALAGSKWKKSGVGFTVTLSPDHSAISTHHNAMGTWVATDSATLRLSISMNNCAAQVLKISADGKQLINEKGDIDLVFEGR